MTDANVYFWVIMALLVLLVLLILCVVWCLARIRRLEALLSSERSELDDARLILDGEQSRLDGLLAAQRSELRLMSGKLESCRRFRHDMRHKLIVLQEFARSGDRAALASALADLEPESADEPLTVCSNPLVDSLARHYFQQAESLGVEIDSIICLSADFWVSSLDIGVFFGNLLENAINAAKEAPEGERRIRIRTRESSDCFVMTVGNTFSGERNELNGSFLSTKPDHEGIGLSSIRAVAEKYGGSAAFSIEDKLFRSSVIMFRPS